MNIGYLLLLTIPLLLLSSCQEDERKPDEKMVHAILRNVSEKLENKYQMHIVGIVEGGGSKGYKTVGLSFDMWPKLSKDEGRRILIDAVNQLLTAINDNKELQRYLQVSPFTEENIDITIIVYNSEMRDSVYHPDIEAFSASDGKLSYKTRSPTKEFGYHLEEEETFEEALRLVNNQDG